MFLIGEYEWRRQANQRNPFLYRPDKEELVDDAKEWLIELFNEKSYDCESRKIFKLFPDAINDFIRYELFTNSGIIKIIFPKGMSDNDRTKYRFVAAAFILHQHYQHYLQREIDLPRDENLIERIGNFLATLFQEFPNDRAYTRIHLDDNQYNEHTAIRQLPEILLETLEKTSFVFIKPNDLRHPHVYNFPNYQEGNHECVQLKFQVMNYKDYEKNTYGEYMRYLLSAERNGMANFGDSTLSFWKNHIGIGRKNEELTMHAEPNKILLIFALALGMDDLVYNRLIELRRGRPVKRKLPDINSKEINLLYNMLKDAHWFLEDARRQVNNNLTEIPQRILENANQMLIKERLNPILPPPTN